MIAFLLIAMIVAIVIMIKIAEANDVINASVLDVAPEPARLRPAVASAPPVEHAHAA